MEVKNHAYVFSEVAFKDYKCVIEASNENSLFFLKKKPIESGNNYSPDLSSIC